MLMRQCELRQGTSRMVTWIEERGARPGVLVEVEGEGTWTVERVYDNALDKKTLVEKQRMDRASLPSIKG